MPEPTDQIVDNNENDSEDYESLGFPALGRQYFVERGVMPPYVDCKDAFELCVTDYRNKFTLIFGIVDYHKYGRPENMKIFHFRQLFNLRSRKINEGFTVPIFDLEKIFFPDELSQLEEQIKESILEGVRKLKNLSLELNKISLDDLEDVDSENLLRITQIWTEIDEITQLNDSIQSDPRNPNK